MPIEDLPTIGISAGRNGGFTRLVLPGDGSGGGEGTVIYFPNTAPPLSTNGAVSFININPYQEFEVANPENDYYGVVSFQGVNALNLPLPEGESIMASVWTFDLSALNLIGAFTVEWFFRITSSLPLTVASDSAPASIEIELFDYVPDENEEETDASIGLDLILLSDGESSLYPILNLDVEDFEDEIEIDEDAINSQLATTFTHAAIEHLGNGSFAAYYNGGRIANFNSATLLRALSINCRTYKVPDLGVSQIKITPSAVYGNAETITPPTTAFYAPP
jgi:hypothetical protein